MSLSRRDVLKIGAISGAAVALPLERIAYAKSSKSRLATSKLPKPFTLPFVRPPEIGPSGYTEVTCFDKVTKQSYPQYQITQTFGVASILPGFKTPVFGYNGLVPGPTIRVFHDNPILVNQSNQLHRPPAAPYETAKMPSPYTRNPLQRTTSTHLHGSASLPQYDGYASDITRPGQTKRYFYPNCQEARTLWYHDHGVHHTSENAYNGLAGMFILHDQHEQALGIPQGPYDVPVVIKDAMFGNDGGLVYDDNSESGVFGDVILVNGVPWPEMVVERRKYRFRILNASTSRSFRWRLHDGRSAVPMTVVGTDGGLVPKPVVVSDFRHSMGERYEVVVDFSQYSDNTLLTLKNLSAKNNVDYSTTTQAMRFRVRGDASSTANNTIPDDWEARVPTAECMTFTEQQLKDEGAKVRKFGFVRKHSQWTINGETWEDVIDSRYRRVLADPDEGDVEIWELANTSGGWFHPVHIHLVDFQILSRNGSAAKVFDYEKGPKDVVYVGENETVRVAMRFVGPSAGAGWPTPTGRYMMHCHNLVHEDHDMMMQFSVGDRDFDPDLDPIEADRAWDD